MRYLWGFVVLFTLAVYSLPYVIKDQTLIWLKQQGVEYPRLTEVSINWYNASFQLKGLVAEKVGMQPLRIDRLTFTVDLLALLDKHILIKKLQLEGVRANYRQQADTQFFGPIDLSHLRSDTEVSDTTKTSMQFGIKTLQLNDVNFAIDTAQHHHHLHIDNAQVDDLYQWAPRELSHLAFEGAFNNAPLKLISSGAPLSANKQSQLQLVVNNFALQSITAPFVPDLSATIDANLTIDITLEKNNIKVKHQGNVAISAFNWHTPRQKLDVDTFNWQGHGELNINPDQTSNADLTGKLTLNNVIFDTLTQNNQKTPQISVEHLTWSGPASAQFDQQTITALRINEQFDLAKLTFKAGVDLTLTSLNIKPGTSPLSISFKDNVVQHIQSSNTTDLSGLSISNSNAALHLKQFSMSHQQPLTLGFKQGLLDTISNHSDINLTKASINQADAGLSAVAERVTVKGPVHLTNLSASPLISAQLNSKVSTLVVQQDPLSFHAKDLTLNTKLQQSSFAKPNLKQSQMTASDIVLTDRSQALTLFSAAKLLLKDINYQPALASIAKLQLQQFNIAKNNKSAALSSVDALVIDKLELNNNNQLNIAKISVTNSEHQLQVAESGQIDLVSQLLKSINTQAGDKQSPPPKADSVAAKQHFQFKIQRINITGDNLIHFQDDSVEPRFKSNINFNKVAIHNLDNQSQQPAPLEVAAVINQSARLRLKGEYALFSDVKQGEWQLALKDLSLPVISPYAGRASGYFLDSGKLNINSTGTIKTGEISGKNKIVVQQLAVRSADSDATKKTNQSLNMPLDLAIALLEDDEGNIHLSVPISGSTDDPNFGYASIVEIIAKKGMKKAAFGILTKSLQPYGALLSIATTLIDANQSGTFINLTPITFAPATTDIAPKMRDYLTKLANMLAERKKLKLKLCGNAVYQDRLIVAAKLSENNAVAAAPLDQISVDKEISHQLQSLATARGEQIKNALMALKVDKDRLFVCFAKVQLKDKEALPSVHLGL